MHLELMALSASSPKGSGSTETISPNGLDLASTATIVNNACQPTLAELKLVDLTKRMI